MLRSVVRFFVLAAFLLVLVAGCGKLPVLTSESINEHNYNVAVWNDDSHLTAAQLYNMVLLRTPTEPAGILDDAVTRRIRDSVLMDTLAGLEASDYDLSQNWFEYRSWRDQVYNTMVTTFWQKMISDSIVVDTSDVLEYYESNPDIFYVAEQVDLYQILCSPKSLEIGADSVWFESLSMAERWALAKEYCENVHRVLDYGEPFENTALRYSHDAMSRNRGGHLGWTPRGVYPDPFDSIAFSLKPGEYSEPYVDNLGWHILLVDGHYQAGPMSLDSAGVWDAAVNTVRNIRFNERGAVLMDSLMGALQLELNESAMEADHTELEDQTWMAVVNGIDTIDFLRYQGAEEPLLRDEIKLTLREIREGLAREFAKRYVVVQLARQHGVDTLPEIVELSNRIRHEKSKALILKGASCIPVEPSDSAIEAYRLAHIEEFDPSQPLTMHELVVQDSALAAFLLEQAETGMELKDLVEEYKAQGYDIRYRDLGKVGKVELGEKYFAVARATRAGKVNKFKAEDGFRVFRVTDNRSPKARALITSDIRTRLKKQQRVDVWKAFRDTIFARHGVKLLNLPAIELPPGAERAAAVGR